MKKLLEKGLNFSLSPKTLDYIDYLANSEFFYGNIGNLRILSNEDIEFGKQEQKKQPLLLLLIKNIITMYNNIFLKKNFLLYQIFLISFCLTKHII